MAISIASNRSEGGSVPPDPRVLELNPAVMEIRQACEELGADAHRSPFFLIVGAGISHPPVPLAASIIDHCQGVAKRYDRAQPPSGQQTLDQYSHWFSRAYPGARQRQQYLRSLIERKPLSLSSLRLAHLLSAHKLTNLVVTTNFDDFIARALRLFGEEPAVCDHPRTVGRIDPERSDIQIVHVHGSYLFYDCANLRGEVTDRARPDEESSFTMVGLLDSLLWTRSPLVVGYSGWEGDVIMSALKRRLRGGNPLAQSVYWFCYRRADRERLPQWLGESPDVRFVVPPEPTQEPPTALRTGAAERAPEPVLPAFAVFDQMNRAFDIGAPALFENPIEYLANSLATALPEAEGPAGDPYAFKALIERLHAASRGFGKIAKTTRGLEADLDRLRALMRESQYPDAVTLLARIIPARLDRLTEDERKEVLAAANLAGNAVFNKPPNGTLPEDLANAMVFDPRQDRLLGPLPGGSAWVVGSRTGQFGTETTIGGKQYGTFTHGLAEALRDPTADADGDGRITLLEAAVAAGRDVLRKGSPHTPVTAGDVDRIALFAAGARPADVVPATLHALLVGVGSYRMDGMELRGPVNDVALLSKVLGTRRGRLFKRAEVHVLLDGQATRAEVGRALETIVRSAKAPDLVLFYYSGHGARGDPTAKAGKGAKPADGTQDMYIIFHDYDGKGAGMVTQREILAALQATKAGQRVAILDF